MSTNRYANAGTPGAGTTIDNMASRVKAWLRVVYSAGVPTQQSFLNISSISDAGVGILGATFTAPFSTATNSATTASSLSTAADYIRVSVCGASTAQYVNQTTGTPTPIDPTAVMANVVGILA